MLSQATRLTGFDDRVFCSAMPPWKANLLHSHSSASHRCTIAQQNTFGSPCLALPRRIAIAELAGVPFTAVSVARVSYAVSAAAPPAGRRLHRMLSDGYSTLLVRIKVWDRVRLSAAASMGTLSLALMTLPVLRASCRPSLG